MKHSKRTLPTVSGGLMNKAFVCVNAASTNIAATFERVRAAQVSTAKVSK